MISTLVAAFPEELVNEVTMGTVNFYAVHANFFSIFGCLGKRCNHFVNVALRHAMDNLLTVFEFFHGAVTGDGAIGFSTEATHISHVPELRHNGSAGAMHSIDHLFPAI